MKRNSKLIFQDPIRRFRQAKPIFTVFSSVSPPSSSSLLLPNNDDDDDDDDDDNLQYTLFKQHHAKGRWQGTWETFDYIGNILDSTPACVHLQYDSNTNQVYHTHELVIASTTSDCTTCFDSTQVKTIPIATYSSSQDLVKRKMRCAYNTMVIGPNMLRSIPGAISTELILPTTVRNYNNNQESNPMSFMTTTTTTTTTPIRVRVIFQHAPVWEKDIQPGSCPPQGLKLFRMILCRETCLQTEISSSLPSSSLHPYFLQNIPPYQWHKKWAGTSWTWTSSLGDQGWNIQELEEYDAWHGRPMGDSDNVWSMRLPGGIYVSCPRVITGDEVGICRCAWLLTNEDNLSKNNDASISDIRLARLEAQIFALQPLIDPHSNNVVGFKPPYLGSLRCDVLTNVGELENASRLSEMMTL